MATRTVTAQDIYASYKTRSFCLPIKPSSVNAPTESTEDETDSVSSSDSASPSLGSPASSVTSLTASVALQNEPEYEDELSKQKEFYWTYQEEPHRTRRMQILKAHPEVTKLCGHEPLTKYVITGVVLLQFTMAYLLRNTPVLSLKFLLTAYVIGATANQNVFLCIHELSHNLGFKKPAHNRLFAIFANLPIGIPYGASFRPYHLIHHKHLGDATLDTDLPTALEALVLKNVAGKAFFATFQIFFYAVRPMCIMRLPFTSIHLMNLIFQLVVDFIMVRFWGIKTLMYFIVSSFLAGSLHPCAGHFIAEHYVLHPTDVKSNNGIPPPETYSYYGILNFFTYNVGLHNEHHDFPFIPWTRLPYLTQIAHEFYDPLPYHESWTKVIYDFVLDDKVSLWSRVKRGVKNGDKEPVTFAKDFSEARTVRDDENGDEDGAFVSDDKKQK
ncbi:fatty acid desaturase-domain-containing protein [Lipomyces arxii]|uniref:fatty acid desaturase-domain-containing protein n=1 Tax=Lipomyces arxii TaxID=56418 RepID=UPI0034CDEC2F